MDVPRTGPQEVCAEHVIIVRFLRGTGKDSDDQIRQVTQVWSHQGHLIAEDDPTLYVKLTTTHDPAPPTRC
jgi:hypothetical protein